MDTSQGIEEQSRRKKLDTLLATGINPYPSKAFRTHTNEQALKTFDVLAKQGSPVTLVGRVKLLRPHGKSTFANIEDGLATIQSYFQYDVLGEKPYALLKQIDVGDFIQVSGELFLTKKGERTLRVKQCVLLCKSLKPLPEKWHGLRDRETRYRKRYLDLLMNSSVRKLFQQRSQFLSSIRRFLDASGFMEVETPILEHVPGGAEAEPFVTHHDTLDIDLYLRISLELHLKRLIVGGYEKIYEIGKVFRNEGMSTQHLQEFTMLELYWAYADWNDLMQMTEQFLSTVIQESFGTLTFDYQGHSLDFTPPWPRISYVEALKEKTGVDIEAYPDVLSLCNAFQEKGITLEKMDVSRGRLIDQFYKKHLRLEIIQPTFLVHHPVDVSPLAKPDPKHTERAERFQLIVVGAEIINGFSELNDPLDQRKRFSEQARLREAGDREAYMFDEDFLHALEYGMPPTAGLGMGIERIFSILTNQESIRDVVFFPIMKPLNEN